MAPTIICEGKAEIVFPEGNQVFYNPIQEFNRDLSIACINVWSSAFLNDKKEKSKQPKTTETEPPSIAADEEARTVAKYTLLEGLAATGLRSLRFALELFHTPLITANDFDKKATASLAVNIAHNKLEAIVTPNTGCCNQILWESIGKGVKFDCIDLDPYGSASQFLDASLRNISEGGLLNVTCTDMAVLAGAQSEACYARYGGLTLHNTAFSHEMGLRMLVGLIVTTASKYDKVVDVLMSCSIDFYARVFVKVRTSGAEKKMAASKMGMVYYCQSCKVHISEALGRVKVEGKSIKFGANRLPCGDLCMNCGGGISVGGPIYLAPIHDTAFVEKLLVHIKASPTSYGTHKRMLGMVSVISEELSVPLYYSLPMLCGVFKISAPRQKTFLSGLLNAGYKVSGTHCKPDCFKTNATGAQVWDALRSYAGIHGLSVGGKGGKDGAECVGKSIVERGSGVVFDFTLRKEAEAESKKAELVRYQENPTVNWGPMRKAGKRAADDKPASSRKLQKTETEQTEVAKVEEPVDKQTEEKNE